VANLANLVLTSNNENALHVSTDDRRFVLFRCSSKYKGDAAYFRTLAEHLYRREVARGVYQYLMGRDLSQYTTDFQPSRPITEYYKEAQLSGIPVIHRFISALVSSSDSPDSYRARQLYENYTQFHSAGNYKVLMTETAFGRELRRIAGIEKKKCHNYAAYLFDKPAIKQHLLDSNRYDVEAEML
jgi:hypothetical protein